MTFNKDTATAICLLLLCGGLLVETFQMPPPMFGQMPATLWPRLILVPLAILSLAMLIRAQVTDSGSEAPGRGLSTWFSYYLNPIVCFALFFVFLLTMPFFGMLIGGLSYVFLTLSFLGGWQPKQMLQHGAVSVVFVVGMWAIFTQLLGVFLPEGVLLRTY
jgi:hypothetical protein